jgi:2-dehydropantoate 2-reductase
LYIAAVLLLFLIKTWTMEKIFIIGTGAIGKALAVFLKQQNEEVILLRGTIHNGEPTAEEIEILLPHDVVIKSTIPVETFGNHQALDGIIVLTTKSFGNAEIAQALKKKVGTSPIVVLQNGLNVEQPFLDNFSSVHRCVLFATSQVISPAKVRFKPVAVSPIGTLKGDSSALLQVVNALKNSHFHFKAVDNIQQVVWQKAIANCVFNSICPLLNIDNGIFHRDERALAIAKVVISECVAIAQASNIALQEKDIAETVLMISKSSDGQLISTLQDINNGRETEIESLNFAIAKLAETLNKAELVQTTRILGQLIKVKSKIQAA